MDDILEGWNPSEWGQSFRGFSKLIQEILILINPKYEDPKNHDEPVTWGEIKELRERVILYLEACGVKIYSGEPKIVQNMDGSFNVSNIHAYSNPSINLSINLSNDTFIHDWYKVRKIDSNSIFSSEHQKSSTDLYKELTPEGTKEVDSIIPIGLGETATWLIRDFKKTFFTGISNDVNIKSFSNKNPRYKNIDFSKTKVIYNFQIEGKYSLIDEKTNKITMPVRDLVTGKVVYITGVLVSCIGFQPGHATKNLTVSRDQIINIPDDTGYFDGELAFIAPQDTPPMSLKDDSLRLLKLEGNLSSKGTFSDFGYMGDFQAFHLNKTTHEIPMPYKKIYDLAEKDGFKISDDFFKSVVDKVKASESHKSEQEFKNILIDIFKDSEIKTLVIKGESKEFIKPSVEHVDRFRDILYNTSGSQEPLLLHVPKIILKRGRLDDSIM